MVPYLIAVYDRPYSYQNDEFTILYVKSSGADSLQQVQIRLAKDGKWYLWEPMLFEDICKQISENPWV